LKTEQIDGFSFSQLAKRSKKKPKRIIT
jgi:hypothetical protein